MLILLPHIVAVGMFAYLFTHPFQKEGEILHWLKRWATDMVDPEFYYQLDYNTPNLEGAKWYRLLIYKLATCEKCLGVWLGAAYYLTTLPYGLTDWHNGFVFTVGVSFLAYLLGEEM